MHHDFRAERLPQLGLRAERWPRGVGRQRRILEALRMDGSALIPSNRHMRGNLVGAAEEPVPSVS
jgi:hypothetical protein